MLNFVSRALLIIVVGALADRFGLRTTFQWCALIGFVSVPFVLLLPRKG